MGIKGLAKLIASEAPGALRPVEMAHYFGKIVAIDAAIVLYQFLTSAREHSSALANTVGDDTGHLGGILYRTLRMLESGIKPIFVFDGKPPKEKEAELRRRSENREKTDEAIAQAKASGDLKLVDNLSRRMVKITDAHVSSCKRLLKILGVPVIVAPGEAEAQCAVLVSSGKAHVVATEDMDALTFGANRIVRRFGFPADKTKRMEEFCLETTLLELGLTQIQFVDLCILLGSDFCDTLKGVGPATALRLIRKHLSIEGILASDVVKKFIIPERFDFKSARAIFLHTNIEIDEKSIPNEFSWSKPNGDELLKYMVEENNFDKNRILNCVERIKKLGKNSGQSTLDSFFCAAKRSASKENLKPVVKKKKK